MKTVSQIVEELQLPEVKEVQGEYEVLSLWAKEIINECAESAHLEYGEDDEYWICKESILKLKEKL